MFFPVCIDIENKKCLVIGGGKIAYKKIKTLSRYNSDITVIAEEIKEEKIREIGNIDIREKRFSDENLREYMLVVAATDDKELNEEIAEFCIEIFEKLGISQKSEAFAAPAIVPPTKK